MNQLDETFNIDTPENVTFGYEIAGVGSRFLAALIDTTLIIIFQVLVDILIFIIFHLPSNFGLTTYSINSWVIAILGLVSLFSFGGYYVFFEMVWNGKTIGKRALKLRVIRIDGTPITISESLIRNLVRLVDFLPAFYGIGVISLFISRQTRRLGDLAAGTLVVREADQYARLKDLAALDKQLNKPVPSSANYPLDVPQGEKPGIVQTTLPVQLLNNQDIQMVEMYLQRRAELTNRDALAAQLIKILWNRMKLADAPPVDKAVVEQTLARILSEYQKAHSNEA